MIRSHPPRARDWIGSRTRSGSAERCAEEMIRQLKRVLLSGLVSAPVIALLVWGRPVQSAPTADKTITTEAEFHQAMKDLSNWGRWGQDDVLGAANLITPSKRKQAAGLVKEGIAVSLAHPIFQALHRPVEAESGARPLEDVGRRCGVPRGRRVLPQGARCLVHRSR
jgi:hypothetical protein